MTLTEQIENDCFYEHNLGAVTLFLCESETESDNGTFYGVSKIAGKITVTPLMKRLTPLAQWYDAIIAEIA